MLITSNAVHLPDHEIELDAICAQGAGGQNVNKVSSVVHLHFNIQASLLLPLYEERLLALNDQHISSDDVVVIKAQQYRTQEQDREDALEHLAEPIRSVAKVQRTRRSIKSTRGLRKRRLDDKARRGAMKARRDKVDF